MLNLFKKLKKEEPQPKERFFSSSEFVSAGHPDRLADNIAAVIINDVQKKDGPLSHAAVEVFITHDTITVSGEVTTTLKIDAKYLRSAVEKAFLRSGYIPEMRQYWSVDEVMLASDFKIVNKIAKQSPDIALGTTDKGEESGWNDQGVYFSSCEDTNPYGLGTAQLLAERISDSLFYESKDSILYNSNVVLGPDNKVVVTVKTAEDGFTPLAVTAVTIAVSHSSKCSEESVIMEAFKLARTAINEVDIPIATNCKWVINGTGRFVIHGPISDTSMTGRKISVNHPSAGPVWCNKMIGGGSLVKPWHASDFLLNVMSRYISEVVVKAGLSSYAVVGCSGAIGKVGLQSIFIKGDEHFEKCNKERVYAFFQSFIHWSPKGIADKFGLFEDGFDFGQAVNHNFFGHPDEQPWEDSIRVEEDAQALIKYIAL